MLFPNARFYVQEDEMRFYTGAGPTVPVVRESIQLPDVLGLLTLNYAGRIRFTEGDQEIMPGVWVHKASGHTTAMPIRLV